MNYSWLAMYRQHSLQLKLFPLQIESAALIEYMVKTQSVRNFEIIVINIGAYAIMGSLCTYAFNKRQFVEEMIDTLFMNFVYVHFVYVRTHS